MVDVVSIIGEENSREVQKINRIFIRKYHRRYHTFLDREELESECFVKLAEYILKKKHKKDSFLKSYATAIHNHFRSLLKKHYITLSRQQEVLFSTLEGDQQDGSSFIDLSEDYAEVEDSFDMIIFKEQVEELKIMLTPLSVAVLKQIVDPDPAFTELVLVHRARKKHINKSSGYTAYEKPKLIATLAEYFGQTKSAVRSCVREIQEACQQIFPKWQSEFNFDI